MAYGDMVKIGGGIQLRKTVTNSGSQPRRDLMCQLYTDIANAISQDPSVILRMKIVAYASQETLVFPYRSKEIDTSKGVGYVFTCINQNVNATAMYIQSMMIRAVASNCIMMVTSETIGSGWSNNSDYGGYTSFNKLELYY